MKVIIAGGRDFTCSARVVQVVGGLVKAGKIPRDFTLVCGMARGADLTAYHLCKAKGNPVEEYPADWNTYGKSAGHRRNREMGDVADCLVAFWDGASRGTKGMIEYMRGLGKPTYVFDYSGRELC